MATIPNESLNTWGKESGAEAVKVATTLIALAGAAGQPASQGNHHYVMVPPNYTAKDITELVEKANPEPNRKRGTVTLKDLDSLLLYCADQDMVGSSIGATQLGYIYADPDQRKITAVFNDHRAPDAPGWRDHRAEYKAEFTPEFASWIGKNKHQFSQTEFAEFIEDNMADITAPAATAMLEMATTIQAKTDINFASAKRLQNGQVQLQYTESIDARAGANGAMEIPKEFNLGLRIFKNGAGYKVTARLKYRLHGGTIKFWYELDRVERAIEDAFSGYVATLREQSGYVVLLGTP
jgi:uncharacterized protein YfdQ (DUF2303 family)